MSSPPRGTLAFGDRYRLQDPVAIDQGHRFDCPGCSQPGALTVRAFPRAGGALICSGAGCEADDIATALAVPPTAFDRDLEAILAADDSRARPGAARALEQSPRDAFAARVRTLEDLANYRPPPALIAGTLRRGDLGFVTGDPGSGKTLLLLSMAAHIATAADDHPLTWYGRAVSPGRVLYVAGEGVHGLADRLSALQEATGLVIPSDRFHVFPDALQLGEPDDLETLLAGVRDNGYALVILDTLARVSAGLDENSARDMGLLVQAADRVKAATNNGSVLIAHHSSAAGKPLRGSTALLGAADLVYSTSREHDVVHVHREKAKDDKPDDHLELLIRPCGPSAVLSLRDDPATTHTTEKSPWPDKLLVLWRVLARSFTDEESFTRSQVLGLVRSAGADDPADAVSPATVHRHIKQLVSMEVLETVSATSRAAARYKLHRARAYELRLPRHEASMRLGGVPDPTPDNPSTLPF